MTRNYIWGGTNPSTGGNPSDEQRQDANVAYADEKEALVKMVAHPNF